MNSDSPLLVWVWTILASIAGALTALSFRPFAQMSRAEIAMALFVGSSFAIFVGPWAVRAYYGDAPVNLQLVGGVFYIMASGSNALVPFLVRKFSNILGATGVEEKPK